jgi:DNA-directed RNA polymerase II subunit RPB2
LERYVSILSILGGGSGHLVEALMSKVGAVMGREGDATPFTEVTVDNISTTLHR